MDDKSLSILIPGAGNAYEAEYLFKNGFKNVYVCDLAIEALQNLKKRCPDFPENQLIHGDFFSIKKQFDVILEQTFFCAIHPKLRMAYAEQIQSLLAPSGTFAGVLFNIDFPFDGPPFGGKIDEYEELFSAFFKVTTLMPCYNSTPPRKGSELFIIGSPKNRQQLHVKHEYH